MKYVFQRPDFRSWKAKQSICEGTTISWACTMSRTKIWLAKNWFRKILGFHCRQKQRTLCRGLGGVSCRDLGHGHHSARRRTSFKNFFYRNKIQIQLPQCPDEQRQIGVSGNPEKRKRQWRVWQWLRHHRLRHEDLGRHRSMRQGPGPRQCQIISSQQKWSRSTSQNSVGLCQILALNIMKTYQTSNLCKTKTVRKVFVKFWLWISWKLIELV